MPLPLSTWRSWEVGERLPRPSHESRIIIGLDCSPLRFELVFLAIARVRLEQHKRERLQLAAQSQDQHAARAVKFEKTMALQQATLEACESLAAKSKLMERITDAKPFVVPECSDAE